MLYDENDVTLANLEFRLGQLRHRYDERLARNDLLLPNFSWHLEDWVAHRAATSIIYGVINRSGCVFLGRDSEANWMFRCNNRFWLLMLTIRDLF